METKLSLLVIAAVFIAGFAAAVVLNPVSKGITEPSLTGAMIQQLPCMSTTGCYKTEVSVDGPIIYLTSGCSRLGITTNELQTFSINSGLTGIRNTRPNTHDAVTDMMDVFGIEPLIVKIERFDQGTYFAKIAFRHNNKILDMDMRPSDAVAIAVRTDTQIWVNQTLLEEYGEYVC